MHTASCDMLKQTDQEKADEVENLVKTSFSQVIANMISAAQHPEFATQYLANMVESFLNLVFGVLKNKNLSEEKFCKCLIQYCDQLENQEYAQIILVQMKRAISDFSQ
jgi:hypothetical protein